MNDAIAAGATTRILQHRFSLLTALQGLSLPASAPLILFLPEEAHLSTCHVVMLGPGEPWSPMRMFRSATIPLPLAHSFDIYGLRCRG